MAWIVCQHCHGQKQIYKEVKPGKWEWQTCPACKGEGVVNTGTI